MKAKILFSSLLFTLICSSQNYINYFNIVNEAEYNFDNQNFNKTIKLLKRANKSFGNLKTKELFYLGISQLIKGDTIQGKISLFKCIENGGSPTKYLPYYKNFENYPVIKSYYNTIYEFEKSHPKKRDTLIRDSLEYFIQIDQSNRAGGAVNSSEIDIINQLHLLKFFETHGFPNFMYYGDGISTIFKHIADSEVYSLYKVYLFKQIELGNMYPVYYAYMVDRYECTFNKQLFYSAYTIGCNVELPKEKIEKNRRSIGLSIYYDGTLLRPLSKSPANYLNTKK